MAMAHTAFRARPAFYRHSTAVAKSGNAFISSLFTPFFRKSHRWALYQRRYYDRNENTEIDTI